MLECVANVSEGRDYETLDALSAACGVALLDRHVDGDHHRSVFTLAAQDLKGVVKAAMRLARAVDGRVDLSVQEGVHPRVGSLDVVPFVALDGATGDDAVAAAHDFAETVAGEIGIPVFFYDRADPSGRTLPSVRRDAFVAREPDIGPPTPHPQLGAVCVGARPLMVAINCELPDEDVGVAAAVARAVRERDGGLPGVRALGFELASKHTTQVSMNLVDLTATGVEAALSEVRNQARQRGSDVVAVELVGLLPAAELARCSDEFLAWSKLGPDDTIESRLR